MLGTVTELGSWAFMGEMESWLDVCSSYGTVHACAAAHAQLSWYLWSWKTAGCSRGWSSCSEQPRQACWMLQLQAPQLHHP